MYPLPLHTGQRGDDEIDGKNAGEGLESKEAGAAGAGGSGSASAVKDVDKQIKKTFTRRR